MCEWMGGWVGGWAVGWVTGWWKDGGRILFKSIFSGLMLGDAELIMLYDQYRDSYRIFCWEGGGFLVSQKQTHLADANGEVTTMEQIVR